MVTYSYVTTFTIKECLSALCIIKNIIICMKHTLQR